MLVQIGCCMLPNKRKGCYYLTDSTKTDSNNTLLMHDFLTKIPTKQLWIIHKHGLNAKKKTSSPD